MQRSLKVSTAIRKPISAGIAALSALIVAPAFLSAGAASAKPIYFDGSYVGAGVAAGVTNGGQQGDAATFGGNIQGRVAIPTVPISVRGAVLFTNRNSTVIPTLTYDVPIADNTNFYIGGGYSFVQKDGQPTPLGNRDAAVVMAGVEAGLGEHIAVYGDAKVGIRAYKNSPASAVSLQAGLGYRF
ncbi:outer membrane beta-barrel protein [Leptothermofonsia sp. ETS-13]|uniref:outer membrane beta-barrel protein n=1 Tax=Leptothermofonsia sp. ETS-13 TaxID=3035696 RepID=UPI003BA171E9